MVPDCLGTLSSTLCQISALKEAIFRQKKSARSKNTQNGQETAWVGAECQIMLGKIVGSEKKVVVPKLQKVEVFGQ